MSQPDEHLIVPASPQQSESIRVGAPPQDALSDLPLEDDNPFRHQPDRKVTFDAVQRCMEIGGVSFWVLGLLISVYIGIVAPDDPFVDWLLRPLIFPIFLSMVGSLLGAAVGLMYWVSAYFHPTDSKADPES